MFRFAWISLLLALLTVPAAAAAGDDDAARKTLDSAVYVLRRSVTVQRDGRHNRLLGALRHLRDPALDPLLARLAASEHPILRIHGILGRAELRQPEPRLLPADLGEIDEPSVQVQLIGTALDNDLLHLDDAAQLLAWDDLEIGVKLLIALRLLEADRFDNAALLHAALEAERIGSRALAAMMLHQLGDDAGTEALQTINQSSDPQRDAARRMMARTALRHGMHRLGAWGHAVTTEANIDAELRRLTLRVALRFGDPRAAPLWQQRFESAAAPAERNRLALAALNLAPWLTIDLFDVMAKNADGPLLERIARAGQAITTDSANVADDVVELVRLNHPIANESALRYARDHAAPTDAQLILLGLVLAFEEAEPQRRVQGLHDVVRATQTLFEQAPEPAAKLLRPILASDDSDPTLVRAILLGLVRTQSPNPHTVLQNVPAFDESENQYLALLLRARYDEPLTERQMRTLSLLARGGGGLQDTLRVQAAWHWLTRTDRADEALQRVMDHLP
ncbi:MAG: hypothetical protein ACODAQ_01620 [Phycisphaeraceae bacterium]